MSVYLFPVGGDDSDVLGSEFGNAPLALSELELGEVADEGLHLSHVEEGGAVGLPLVFPHHPMEYHWEPLQTGAIAHTINQSDVINHTHNRSVVTNHTPHSTELMNNTEDMWL